MCICWWGRQPLTTRTAEVGFVFLDNMATGRALHLQEGITTREKTSLTCFMCNEVPSYARFLLLSILPKRRVMGQSTAPPRKKKKIYFFVWTLSGLTNHTDPIRHDHGAYHFK